MIKRSLYFGNPAYLSLKLRQLVIRKPEVKGDMPDFDDGESFSDVVKTIPVEDIGLIVLDCPQITVTEGLLEALLENNCAVVTCASRIFQWGFCFLFMEIRCRLNDMQNRLLPRCRSKSSFGSRLFSAR